MIKYVNNGTYGCVMTPNAPCSDGKSSDTSISKIFKEKTEAKSELALNDIVRAIDPEGKFTVKVLGNCDVQTNRLPAVELGKCSNFKDIDRNKESLHQIVYEHGGQDLRVFKDLSFEKLFLRMKPLFDGLIVMEKTGYTHYDIKPENIVYNPNTKKMAYIDFGLAHKTEGNYDYTKFPDLHTFLNFTYYYYPPEFRLFYDATRTYKSYDDMCSTARNRNKYLTYIEGYDLLMKKYVKKLTGEIHKLSATAAENFDIAVPYTFGSKRHAHFLEMVDEIEKKQGSYFDHDIAKKVDVYSLGISLLQVFLYAHLRNDTSIAEHPKFYNQLFLMIFKMTDFNVAKRATPTDALRYFKITANALMKKKTEAEVQAITEVVKRISLIPLPSTPKNSRSPVKTANKPVTSPSSVKMQLMEKSQQTLKRASNNDKARKRRVANDGDNWDKEHDKKDDNKDDDETPEKKGAALKNPQVSKAKANVIKYFDDDEEEKPKKKAKAKAVKAIKYDDDEDDEEKTKKKAVALKKPQAAKAKAKASEFWDDEEEEDEKPKKKAAKKPLATKAKAKAKATKASEYYDDEDEEEEEKPKKKRGAKGREDEWEHMMSRLHHAMDDDHITEYIKNPDTGKKIKVGGKKFLELLKERGWGFWLEDEDHPLHKKPKARDVDAMTKKQILDKAERWRKRHWIPSKVKNPDTNKFVSVTGDIFYKLVREYGWEFWNQDE